MNACYDLNTVSLSPSSKQARAAMWKQDLKKIAVVAVGVGGAYALYKYRYNRSLERKSHLPDADTFIMFSGATATPRATSP